MRPASIACFKPSIGPPRSRTLVKPRSNDSSAPTAAAMARKWTSEVSAATWLTVAKARCVCMSMSPGIRVRPRPSMVTSAIPGAAPWVASSRRSPEVIGVIDVITPASTRTSRAADSRGCTPSKTRTSRNTRLGAVSIDGPLVMIACSAVLKLSPRYGGSTKRSASADAADQGPSRRSVRGCPLRAGVSFTPSRDSQISQYSLRQYGHEGTHVPASTSGYPQQVQVYVPGTTPFPARTGSAMPDRRRGRAVSVTPLRVGRPDRPPRGTAPNRFREPSRTSRRRPAPRRPRRRGHFMHRLMAPVRADVAT